MKNTPITVTPKLAARWLTKNTCNRPLSQRTVETYAAAMTAKEWQLNGDTVRFDRNGNLIDGQHRLHACVKSGKSFSCYVVKDLPPEAFDTIDQGRPRTMADVLARRGEKNYTTLSSALRYIWRVETNKMSGHVMEKFRPQVMDDILKRHPGIRDAVDAVKALHPEGHQIISLSMVSCFYYIFNKIKPMKNKEFWERIIEGTGLEKSMPEYQLRRRLLSNAQQQAKVDPSVVAALVVKTWNAASQNKPLQSLRWTEAEAFPKISGMQATELKIAKMA